MSRRRRLVVLCIAVSVLGPAMSACSEHVPRPEVAIRLDDYTLTVSSPRADEGVVKIFVDNDGEQAHELVLVRARSRGDLALLPDGSVDVAKAQVADRLVSVRPGLYRIEPELYPGPLVLFCNLVTKGVDGQPISHFQRGMVGELDIRLTTTATTRGF